MKTSSSVTSTTMTTTMFLLYLLAHVVEAADRSSLPLSFAAAATSTVKIHDTTVDANNPSPVSSSSSSSLLDAAMDPVLQWLELCSDNLSTHHVVRGGAEGSDEDGDNVVWQRSFLNRVALVLGTSPPEEEEENKRATTTRSHSGSADDDSSSSSSSATTTNDPKYYYYSLIALQDFQRQQVILTVPQVPIVGDQQQQQQQQQQQPKDYQQKQHHHQQQQQPSFCNNHNTTTTTAATSSTTGMVVPPWRVLWEEVFQREPKRQWLQWSNSASHWIKTFILGGELEPTHFGMLPTTHTTTTPPPPPTTTTQQQQHPRHRGEHDNNSKNEGPQDEDEDEEDETSNASIISWVSPKQQQQSRQYQKKQQQQEHQQQQQQQRFYSLIAMQDIRQGQTIHYKVLSPSRMTDRSLEDDDDDEEEEDDDDDLIAARRRWAFSTGYYNDESSDPPNELLLFDVLLVPSLTDPYECEDDTTTTTTTPAVVVPVVHWWSKPPALSQLNWLQSHYRRLTESATILEMLVETTASNNNTTNNNEHSSSVVSSSSSSVWMTPLEQTQFLVHYQALVQALEMAIIYQTGSFDDGDDTVGGTTPDHDEKELQEIWLDYYCFHHYLLPPQQQKQGRATTTPIDDNDSSSSNRVSNHMESKCQKRLLLSTPSSLENKDGVGMDKLVCEGDADTTCGVGLQETADLTTIKTSSSDSTNLSLRRRGRRRRRVYDRLDERLVDVLPYHIFKETQFFDMPPDNGSTAQDKALVDYREHVSQSFYQTMKWTHFYQKHDDDDDDDDDDHHHRRQLLRRDTCLHLDHLFHSSTGSRPHVHETIVHYPASFLSPGGLRRVLYVGGGDLFLLHEILKYPSLELVIGMELDQAVVRTSFQHYGIPPQFDNPKVQWWFGDASKSLAMLPPDEYFGTFDLVIIDLLSYVFDSLKVQPSFASASYGDDDIHNNDCESYSLSDYMMKLLQPQGILIRQEDFVVRNVVDFAKYTVELDLSYVPYILHQSFTMGSNGIDFLTRSSNNQRYDHQVETVFYTPWTDHFQMWSGYHTGEQRGSSCCLKSVKPKRADDDGMTENGSQSERQDKAAGILFVVEAENATTPLDDMLLVQAKFQTALQNAGMENTGLLGQSMSSSTNHSSGDNDIISPFYYKLSFLMTEGYLTARIWPARRYCAFDLELWKSIDKRYQAVAQLVSSVGAKSSSFQIVTGGMKEIEVNGSTTPPTTTQAASTSEMTNFLDDKSLLQKQSHLARLDVSGNQSGGELLSSRDFHVVVQELTVWATSNNSRLVVICPHASQSPCASMEALGKNPARNIVPLWTCPTLVVKNGTNSLSEASNDNLDDDDDDDDAFLYAMLDCERQMRLRLRDSTLQNNNKAKISGIVIDPETPVIMGRILHKVLNNTRIRTTWLSHECVVLAPHEVQQRQDADSTAAATQSWRHALLERFRAEMFYFNPLFHAQITFRATGTQFAASSTMRVGLLSVGDDNFYTHISEAFAKIKERAPHIAHELTKVKVGLTRHIPDYDPPLTVSNVDYDLGPALEQWESQQVLGHQTIWLWELQLPKPEIPIQSKVLINVHMHAWLGKWFMGRVVEHNAQPDTNERLYRVILDSNGRMHLVRRNQLHFVGDDGIAFSTPLAFGESVFLNWQGEKDIWYQGHVSGVDLPDGLYKVACHYDADILLVERSKLIRRREELPLLPEQGRMEGQGADQVALSALFSCEELERLSKEVLHQVPLVNVSITCRKEIGTGCIVMANFVSASNEGDLSGDWVAIWDGHDHLEVNLFVASSSSDSIHDVIEQGVAQEISRSNHTVVVSMVQKDAYPRGIGRVVVDTTSNSAPSSSSESVLWFGQVNSIPTKES